MPGKTTRKQRTSKSKGRRPVSPWVMIGGVLAVVALAVGWWLGLRPEVRKPAVEDEVIREGPDLTSKALRDSLQATLVELGISLEGIRKGRAEGQPHRWEWAVDLPAERNLIRANLMISEAVARWGGRVWEGQEFKSHRTGGSSVRIALGSDSQVFGWLLLEGSAEAPKPARAEPRLAIVIDDFGYSIDSVVEAFVRLPYPITMAILPAVPHSREIFAWASEAGHDCILHLPMEPRGYPRENPGPGAILIDMDEDDILQTFDENLAYVPGAVGFSNHMGSAATEDPLVMRAVLREAARRGLFFLDSLTTPRSVGSRVATECGVAYVTNDLFIDNDPEDLESIERMIRRLGRIAQARGWAVGIGHPHRTTLQALREVLPELESEGLRIVPVAELATVRVARR